MFQIVHRKVKRQTRGGPQRRGDNAPQFTLSEYGGSGGGVQSKIFMNWMPGCSSSLASHGKSRWVRSLTVAVRCKALTALNRARQ